MTVPLSGALAAAQDLLQRNPLIQVASIPLTQDIPFSGNVIEEGTALDSFNDPKAILHSSGAICVVCVDVKSSTSENLFNYYYTDTDRTFLTKVVIHPPSTGVMYPTPKLVSLVELANGTLGIMYIASNWPSGYALCCMRITFVGQIISDKNIQSSSSNTPFLSPSVILLNNGSYLFSYIVQIASTITTSGVYSGLTKSTFEIDILSSGNQTNSQFRWRKDIGVWSSAIGSSASPILLQEGVYISFPVGNYWTGQLFTMDVIPAVKAGGSLSVVSLPNDGDVTIVGDKTYIWRTDLSVPTTPYEVKIDPLGYEICAENLHCAIMGVSYQGTGEGIRYGVGTLPNGLISVTRHDFTLSITALVAGLAGNSIPLTTDGVRVTHMDMSGGSDPFIGTAASTTSSRIYKKTSADFITWTADEEVLIPSLNPSLNKLNCSLEQIQDGSVLLSFDYQTLGTSLAPIYNCYYMISLDNGVTWGNPIALTNYMTSHQYATHPTIAQKPLGGILSVIDEDFASLTIDGDSPDYYQDHTSYENGSNTLLVRWLQYDLSQGALYVVSCFTYAVGDKVLRTVLKIDVSTWKIIATWHSQGTVRFNQVFFDLHVSLGPFKWRGARHYVLVGLQSAGERPVLSVLDGISNTITNFVFGNWPQYGLYQNVNTGLNGTSGTCPWRLYKQPGGVAPSPPYFTMCGAQVDYTNNKIYVFWYWEGSGNNFLVTTLNLTDTHPPFETTKLWSYANPVGGYISYTLSGVRAFIDASLIVMYGVSFMGQPGYIVVFALQGGLIKRFRTGQDAIPTNVMDMFYYNGKLYFTFTHNVGDPGSGLGIIDISTWTVTYAQPTWTTGIISFNDGITVTEDGVLILTCEHGVVLYDTNLALVGQDPWSIINNENDPGLTPDGVDDTDKVVAYDPAYSLIFFGHGGYPTSFWYGVVAVSRYGKIIRSFYSDGTYIDDAWSFSPYKQLVQGTQDFNAVAIVDPDDNGIWAFWTRYLRKQSLVWDKQTPSYDLTKMLDRNSEVSLKRSIETGPAQLNFSMANGHLFDDYNNLSLLGKYLKKGRKISIAYGESVNGVSYWQQYGWYLIRNRRLTYQRNTAPVMQVGCEDIRTFWGEQLIHATPLYEHIDPDVVLKELITEYSNMPNDMVEGIGPLSVGGMQIQAQWVDVFVNDIIDQLVKHFGHFIDIDVNGQFRVRPISKSNQIDNIYNDVSLVQQFTPNDDYANWVNRITITAESLDYIEVTYEEERVQSIHGTIGWWGQKKTYNVHYSQDDSKRYLNPNLVIKETAQSILIKLMGGVKEHLTFIDPQQKYCVVSIEAPNLVPMFLAACAAFIASMFIPDYVTTKVETVVETTVTTNDYASGTSLPGGGPVFTVGTGFGAGVGTGTGVGIGFTIPWGTIVRSLILMLIAQILGSISNFQFEIWAFPIGYIRQSFQSSVEDEVEMANNGNIVVEKVISDVMCHTPAECYAVAKFYLMYYAMQRYRVNFTKLANIQDEQGDTIQVIHPFSKAIITVFIDQITRKYKPSSPGSLDGYFFDEIEAWIVEGVTP